MSHLSGLVKMYSDGHSLSVAQWVATSAFPVPVQSIRRDDSSIAPYLSGFAEQR
ncbi:hypothetical protein [Coleofasciculus sp. FACHB-SPT9]|uniref:hypothetical protein n=1 Tax=Coleofasciculus sp. FACHB-SPT9 TaxID=2692791 RepID=UPI0016839951|nr:hypothetical protein [Coleofasciculus sp. FACHB-SPT9]MBD1888032.1 hypothetical protein [Coleofasciculus sp. FACHB-SPT9]